MNQYEAIFVRKSIRHFRMDEIPKEKLDQIVNFYQDVPSLFPGIQTEIGITENLSGKHVIRGLFPVKAPYYLSIFTEKKDRSEMNAGYVMQQLSLYMDSIGIGSCFLWNARLKEEQPVRGSKVFVILMAFGYPKEPLTRHPEEARRLPLNELCVYKNPPSHWMKQVLEAARMAPSDANRQPWRFVVVGSRIHIFSKKANMNAPDRYDEFSFGAMFANIMVASDELWLDVDLIRLENISQKNFKSSQYVLSAIVKPPEYV